MLDLAPLLAARVRAATGSPAPVGPASASACKPRPDCTACRMMQLEDEARREPGLVLDMAALLAARVEAAAALRRTLGLPSACTTVYRLINRCVFPQHCQEAPFLLTT